MTRRISSPTPPLALTVALLLGYLWLVGCGAVCPRRPDRPGTPPARTSAIPRRPKTPPLAPAGGGSAAHSRGTAEPAINVVICVLDAARADRLGCYGYPRDTTPNLDRVARESFVFRSHFATCAETTPSTASLFTGLYPDTLGMVPGVMLDPSTPTLPEALQAAGSGTALFTVNVSASPETGLGGGFQQVFPEWVRHESRGHAAPPGPGWLAPRAITREFGTWLASRRSARFFAYLHFLPPHFPYEAGPEFVRAVAGKRPPAAPPGRLPFPELASSRHGIQLYPPQEWADLYDANLRLGDWGVGEIVRLLREQGLLDRTLLIVTADHGEAFGEHGYFGHVHAVYDEFVHIPLLIRLPGQRRASGEVTALTQTVDLLPTICDLLRLPYPHRVQGRSLRPLLTGKKRAVRDYVFAVSVWSAWPAYLVRNGQWALLLYRGGKLKALYDLRKDPAEQQNVIAQHPNTVARMTAALRAFAHTQGRSLDEYVSPGAPTAPPPPWPAGDGPARARRTNPRPLSENARRELKALGYLE